MMHKNTNYFMFGTLMIPVSVMQDGIVEHYMETQKTPKALELLLQVFALEVPKNATTRVVLPVEQYSGVALIFLRKKDKTTGTLVLLYFMCYYSDL
jgi:hypothetical protein